MDMMKSNFRDAVALCYDPYSYSGRGMYGKRCLAITVDNLPKAVAEITHTFMETFAEESFMPLDEIIHIFERAETDSMGLNTVLYFPNIEWDESEV